MFNEPKRHAALDAYPFAPVEPMPTSSLFRVRTVAASRRPDPSLTGMPLGRSKAQTTCCACGTVTLDRGRR
jgi:hypothetical protein